MRPIDADAFDGILCDAEIEATKQKKYVLAGAINTIRGNMAKQPTVNQWIPCSERLPKELSVVNVTYVNHNPVPYYDFVKDIAFTETAVYYQGDWYWNWSGCKDVLAEYGRDDANKVDKAVEVIAWMPLPAIWEEGESNG